jgi:hypothetical protein
MGGLANPEEPGPTFVVRSPPDTAAATSAPGPGFAATGASDLIDDAESGAGEACGDTPAGAAATGAPVAGVAALPAAVTETAEPAPGRALPGRGRWFGVALTVGIAGSDVAGPVGASSEAAASGADVGAGCVARTRPCRTAGQD